MEKNWDDDHLQSSFFLHHLPWEFLHLFVAKHTKLLTNFFCFGDTRHISTAQNFLVSGRLEVTWRQLIWTCWFGFPHEDWFGFPHEVFWSLRSKFCLRQILQRKFFWLALLLVVKGAEGPMLLLFSRLTAENNDDNSTCHFKMTSVTNVVIKEWQQKRWQSFCWKWKTFIICEEKTNVFVISFVIPEKWWWQMTGVAKKCCWGRLQNDSLTYLRDLWRKREMTAVIENEDDRHFLDDTLQPP